MSRSISAELWPYTEEALRQLLKNNSIHGAGKAIGLTLCDRLVQNFNSGQFKMSVPSWSVLSKEECQDRIESRDRSLIGHILRSSASDEDWLNGGSGGHKSFPVPSFMDLLCLTKSHITTDNYVQQKYQPGYGLVIDIAYSTLANQVLIKVASGLKRFIAEDINRPYYTSATADSEASVKVFDPINSNLFCQSLCDYRDSAFSLIDNQGWNNFNSSLCKSLQLLGINFAVQLECILNPDCPDQIFLVQLRPSPAGTFSNEPLAAVDNSRVYFDSGVFNRPGSTGFCGFDVIESIDYSRYLFGNQYEQPNLIAVLDRSKINAYEMNASNAAQAYTSLVNRGYKAIITPFALDPSFRHDKLEEEGSSDRLFMKLSEHCHIVSLPHNTISQLIEDKSSKLAIQIDGIIARTYLQRASF